MARAEVAGYRLSRLAMDCHYDNQCTTSFLSEFLSAGTKNLSEKDKQIASCERDNQVGECPNGFYVIEALTREYVEDHIKGCTVQCVFP